MSNREGGGSNDDAGRVPPLLVGLVDDAAVFPPGSAPLPAAVRDHRAHRSAWYAALVGPLLVPVTATDGLDGILDSGEPLEVGLIGDTGVDRLAAAAEGLPAEVRLRQVEVAVAKRGEDPLPALSRLVTVAASLPDVEVYAEIPLSWGLLGALDAVADARGDGVRISPKFRTGGLAAELFPTPVELAEVICGCRDRGLAFKLTAGLHRAVRHNDPETGFTHHGFVNILAASIAAGGGATVAGVAGTLRTSDPVPLIEAVRDRRSADRPLWKGFGSCSIAEPLADLIGLGLVAKER